MEISFFKDKSFKLKGRTASVITLAPGFRVEEDKKAKMDITEPGEYEVSGVSIIGISSKEGSVFVLEMDGLRIAFLGKDYDGLSDEKVSQLGSIDIVIIEVGENLKEALRVVSAIDPYYILPFSKSGSTDSFLSESGISVEKTDKFSIKKEEILEDQGSKIILLPEK